MHPLSKRQPIDEATGERDFVSFRPDTGAMDGGVSSPALRTCDGKQAQKYKARLRYRYCPTARRFISTFPGRTTVTAANSAAIWKVLTASKIKTTLQEGQWDTYLAVHGKYPCSGAPKQFCEDGEGVGPWHPTATKIHQLDNEAAPRNCWIQLASAIYDKTSVIRTPHPHWNAPISCITTTSPVASTLPGQNFSELRKLVHQRPHPSPP